MTSLYLLDPEPSPAWFPFQDSRPVSELRAGAWLIRERWEAIAQAETTLIFAPPHLYQFVEPDVPSSAGVQPIDGPAMVGRSEFAPAGVAPAFDPAGPAVLTHEGVTVGWWVPAGATWSGPEHEGLAVEVEGLLLRGAWDLVTALEHLLHADCADFVAEGGDPVPDAITVIGDPQDLVILGGTVEPGAVFNVLSGAIVLEQGSYVAAGSQLVGPCYIGPHTVVLGGHLRQVAAGPQCRIRGEMAQATFLGYANKAHDGFVGHSVIGRWANLGAGTITSNLKNTYGPVSLDIEGARTPTERQYLGSLVGDHAKTAIGTLLGTGTLIGAGANVFGAVRPPRYVPPFAWGTEGKTVTQDGFLTVAGRVMPRRQVAVDDAVRQMLETLYRHAAE